MTRDQAASATNPSATNPSAHAIDGEPPHPKRERIDERMRELRSLQEQVRERKRAQQQAAKQRRIQEQKQTLERLRAGVERRRQHTEDTRRRTQQGERTAGENSPRTSLPFRTLEQERRERRARELTAHESRHDGRSATATSDSGASHESACTACPVQLFARGRPSPAHGSGARDLAIQERYEERYGERFDERYEG
ncbi:hypothetical protein GCM10027406_10900 [Leifsonia lichenia]